MPKFNITAVGSGESKPANEMRWVNLSQLEDDPMNEEIYNTDGIEELAADIELNGLMQYPLVRFMPGGMYRIISGHRRVKAIRLLAKKDKTQWKTIPVVLDSDTDETSIAIKLISANAVNRHMTRREQFLQALKLYELLTEQKEKENLPGRVRDMVAKKLNISSGNVGAFLQLANNLNGILLNYYLDGSMSKSAAIEASKLPDEEQDALIEAIEYGDIDPPQLLSADIIRAHFAKYFEDGKEEQDEIKSGGADESVSHSDTQKDEDAHIDTMPRYWNPSSGYVKDDAHYPRYELECEECYKATINCQGCCARCQNRCHYYQECAKEKKKQDLKDKYGNGEIIVSSAIRNLIGHSVGIKESCDDIREIAGGCPRECPLCVDGTCNLPDYAPSNIEFLMAARATNRELDYEMEKARK